MLNLENNFCNNFNSILRSFNQNAILEKAIITRLLHGSSFMRNYHDEIKYKVFEFICLFVKENVFKIMRSVYKITEKNRDVFYTLPIDPKINNGKKHVDVQNAIIGLCFTDLITALQEYLEKNAVTLVIENNHSDQQKRNFSGLIASSHQLLLNPENLQFCPLPYNLNIAPPKYMNKIDSIFLCLTDCIAYVLDSKLKSFKRSVYTKKLLEIFNIIPNELLIENFITVNE